MPSDIVILGDGEVPDLDRDAKDYYLQFFKDPSFESVKKDSGRSGRIYKGFCKLCATEKLSKGHPISGQFSYANFRTQVHRVHSARQVKQFHLILTKQLCLF